MKLQKEKFMAEQGYYEQDLVDWCVNNVSISDFKENEIFKNMNCTCVKEHPTSFSSSRDYVVSPFLHFWINEGDELWQEWFREYLADTALVIYYCPTCKDWDYDLDR